jgi:hypothetical protein
MLLMFARVVLTIISSIQKINAKLVHPTVKNVIQPPPQIAMCAMIIIFYLIRINPV